MDPTPLTSTRPIRISRMDTNDDVDIQMVLRNIIRLMERGDSADDAVSHLANVNAAEPVSFQEINTFMKEMISIFKSPEYQSTDPATNKVFGCCQDPATIKRFAGLVFESIKGATIMRTRYQMGQRLF
jgi:hypothetical protein